MIFRWLNKWKADLRRQGAENYRRRIGGYEMGMSTPLGRMRIFIERDGQPDQDVLAECFRDAAKLCEAVKNARPIPPEELAKW